MILPPQEMSAPAFRHPPMEGPSPPAGEALTWTTPEGWQEQPGQGMRRATFMAGEATNQAECSLVVLSSAAGGLAANVNRWIGQLGLDTPTAEGLEAFLSRQRAFTTDGGDPGVLIDLTELGADTESEAGSMMVGVVTRAGQTVFVKLVGPGSVLRAERAQLLKLCKSFN